MNFIRQTLLQCPPRAPEQRMRVVANITKNIRLRAAARREYLHSRFKLPNAAETEELLHFHRAPSRARTLEIFPALAHCKYLGNADVRREELLLELAKEEDIDLNSWPLEDLLECCGCFVHGTSAFNLFCEVHGVYELWQEEYICALAQYLSLRGLSVLEIGAGSGRLFSLIKRYSSCPSLHITATDSGAWRRMPGMKSTGNIVVPLAFDKSLKRFAPQLVLCSWMPMNEDWTRLIRSTSSVQEYILIGDPTCTGREQETWSGGEVMTELTALQYCRHDRALRSGHSQTKRFRIVEN